VNAKIKKEHDQAPPSSSGAGTPTSPNSKHEMREFQKNFKRSMSQVQSRIASEVRMSKANGRSQDPWNGNKNGSLVLDNKTTAQAAHRGDGGLSEVPNVVVLTPGEGGLTDAAASREESSQGSQGKPSGEASHEKRRAPPAAAVPKRGAPKRTSSQRSDTIAKAKADRRKTKAQDPFDFDFQLVISDDMPHLLDSRPVLPPPAISDTGQGHEEKNEVSFARAPAMAASSVAPGSSSSHSRARSASHTSQHSRARSASHTSQPEEPLTAKIELLRQQCEDGLGMDVFQAAYSALREHPNRDAKEFNDEVVEFLPDLLTLIRCEDIVYA